MPSQPRTRARIVAPTGLRFLLSSLMRSNAAAVPRVTALRRCESEPAAC
jgi:hypothetical protein